VTEPKDLEDAVKKALATAGPVVVDIDTDPARFV
jgi:thiamine pyrophosphate-dependent acetolactate synthase large subunit-like protein